MKYDERKKYYEKIAQKESLGVDPQFTESWENGFVEGCIYKDFHQNCITCSNHSSNTKLMQAKELLKNLIRVTWGEGWNYSLDWKVKAENFLKEIE